jgi:molecular chaperone DnaK (HSP70)
MGDRQSAPPSEIDFRAGGKALISRIRETVSQNVPEETKNRFNESLRQTQEFFSNKMPPERREKLQFRLKKMIVEIQGHPDCRYSEAFSKLDSEHSIHYSKFR